MEATPEAPPGAVLETTVLITGVRGKTGVPLARSLVRRGVAVRGGTSRPDDVDLGPDLDGVTPTAFDWDDAAGWPAATAGVHGLFLVRPDRPDAPELVAALLQQVPERARVVLLSERRADDTGVDGWAPRVEQVVRGGSHPWVVLRPSWFTQVFIDDRFYLDLLRDGGELAFPSGGAAVSWIDAADIGAVAEVALVDGGHDGEVLELSGPESSSLPETAARLTALTGRPVVHRDAAVAEVLQGLEGFERELTEITFERVRAGSYAATTGEVERVTGRPARSLEQTLAQGWTRST